MKVFIIISVLLKAFVLSSAELDLKQLKELALKASSSVNAAEMYIESIEGQSGTQRSKFLPRLGIQVGREWTKADNFSDEDNFRAVYGTINLFNGFKDSNQLKRSKLLKLSEEGLLKNKKLDLELEIEGLYYTYLFLEKKLEVTQEAIKRNGRHLKLVNKRLKSSLVTKTDVLEFKLRSSQLVSERDFIELELLRIKKRLLKFSGIQDFNSYSLKGDLPHLHLKTDTQKLIQNKLDRNADIQSLNYTVQDFELSQKISNSGWYPRVDLQASYGRLDENETGVSNNLDASQVTLMATWELFSGGATRSLHKTASAQKMSVEYQLRQKKLDLSLQVESLIDQIRILQKRIDSTEVNQKVASKLYSRTLNEYQKGVKRSGDLVTASDLFRNLSSEIYEMKLKFLSSKIELERLIGSNLNFELIKH